MAVDGKIGEMTTKEVQIITELHPPVIITVPLKANQGYLELGSIIAKNNNGENVLYDPSDTNQQIVGVLANSVDTNRQDIGNVIVHGVVVRKFLKAKKPVDDKVIEKLNQKTIWSI